MKGNRFEGLSDDQWKVLEKLLVRSQRKEEKASPTLHGEKSVIAFYGYLLMELEDVIYPLEINGLQDR